MEDQCTLDQDQMAKARQPGVFSRKAVNAHGFPSILYLFLHLPSASMLYIDGWMYIKKSVQRFSKGVSKYGACSAIPDRLGQALLDIIPSGRWCKNWRNFVLGGRVSYVAQT